MIGSPVVLAVATHVPLVASLAVLAIVFSVLAWVFTGILVFVVGGSVIWGRSV